MNVEQARQVEAALRRLGAPGVIAPKDPNDPQGPWRVYGQVDPEQREDVTADALAAVAARVLELEAELARHGSGPTRGFIL